MTTAGWMVIGFSGPMIMCNDRTLSFGRGPTIFPSYESARGAIRRTLRDRRNYDTDGGAWLKMRIMRCYR